MEVIDDVTTCECTFPNLVLTVGSFDGVHLGHQQILQTVIARAKAIGGAAGLMSLSPHPKAFFSPDASFALLTEPKQKEGLLRAAGLDVYFVLPFNATIARMEPEEFLTGIILGKCHAVTLVVGHDFSFGARARGNYDYLAAESARLGYTVEMVPPVLLEGERVSSTGIRDHVLKGEMERAAQLLGRPFTVSGVVARGRGMGVELGYPTANIVPDAALLPAHGIYAAKVRLDGTCYLGAVNIGIAPTIPHDRPMIEVHLLDFTGELAGRHLDVELRHRLRGEQKFDGLESLKAGIENDIVNIRRYFVQTPD